MCVFILVAHTTTAQYLKRSSLGMAGSTSAVTSLGKPRVVSQSIGQASTIGSTMHTQYGVSQGYQQPPAQLFVLPLPNNKLAVEVYPNPVETFIHISFQNEENKAQTNELSIRLYNVAGNLVFTDAVAPVPTYKIDMELLHAGVYILKLSQGDRQFAARIIKK